MAITIFNITTSLEKELHDILIDLKKNNKDLNCSEIISELLEILVYEDETLKEFIVRCIENDCNPEIL